MHDDASSRLHMNEILFGGPRDQALDTAWVFGGGWVKWLTHDGELVLLLERLLQGRCAVTGILPLFSISSFFLLHFVVLLSGTGFLLYLRQLRNSSPTWDCKGLWYGAIVWESRNVKEERKRGRVPNRLERIRTETRLFVCTRYGVYLRSEGEIGTFNSVGTKGND